MSASSLLTLDFEDEGKASTIFASIIPEVKHTKPGIAKVSIAREGRILVLEIEASSVAVLRALLNSYIRWMSTSLEVMELGD